MRLNNGILRPGIVLEVVDNIGVLQTALIGLGAGIGIKKSIKGEGRVKKFTLINMPSVA